MRSVIDPGIAKAVNSFLPNLLSSADLFEQVKQVGDEVIIGLEEGYKKIISSAGRIQSFLTRKNGEIVVEEIQIPAQAAQVVVAAIAGEMGGQQLSAFQKDAAQVINLLADVFNSGGQNVFRN